MATRKELYTEEVKINVCDYCGKDIDKYSLTAEFADDRIKGLHGDIFLCSTVFVERSKKSLFRPSSSGYSLHGACLAEILDDYFTNITVL